MRFSMLAGNMLVERIRTRSVRTMSAASAVCGVSIIVLAFQNTFLLLFAGILVFEFLLGIIYPLRETVLNREIANENRATVLSFHSMVVCIFNYISMLVMGKLALAFSIRATWILSGAVLCMSAAVLFLTERGKKNVRKLSVKALVISISITGILLILLQAADVVVENAYFFMNGEEIYYNSVVTGEYTHGWKPMSFCRMQESG